MYSNTSPPSIQDDSDVAEIGPANGPGLVSAPGSSMVASYESVLTSGAGAQKDERTDQPPCL